MALLGVSLSAGVVVGANRPIDVKYGPFANVALANSEIGETLRYQGLTVGILDAGTVKEYWYQDGILDSNLVLKQNGGGSAGSQFISGDGTIKTIIKTSASGFNPAVADPYTLYVLV